MILEYFYYINQNIICPLIYCYDSDYYLISINWLVNKNVINKINFIYKRWNDFEEKLNDYFNKKIKFFDIKLRNTGSSDFEKKVFNELRHIPYGNTLSYKDIADKINHPKAYRAIGQICKKNYYPIIIPCHRVISINGIGGYAGKTGDTINIVIKKKLLEIEGTKLKFL
jgi:methylated-DNA-[protein]-cysteine S-methyltransferase